METLLEARNLHKSYVLEKVRLEVLKGASFSVSAGESVAVVGMSGAGKSTLLHILGGLDAPDSGEVCFRGINFYQQRGLARARIRARSIGFVFQSYHLFAELDVLENAILPAMTGLGRTTGPSGMRERGREILASVGLGDRSGHTPLELSGGEQQRLALARALMNEPEIILADEPTGNLDDETGEQVLKYLFCDGAERPYSLVIVTHNQSLAKRCDRTLRLLDGAIEEIRAR